MDIERIEALIDGGRFADARTALGALTGADPAVAVLRLKLALREGTLPADIVMQRLTQLMRSHPELVGARALYALASEASFDHGHSSPAHSHPPPPIKPERD